MLPIKQTVSGVMRALAATAAIQVAATGFATAETELLFNLFVSPKHPFNTGIYKPWADRVAAESDGRVKVAFTSASLGPPQKQWNLVTKGIADVAMLANPFERNRLILPQIATLPFMGRSAEKGSVALWRTQRHLFEAADEYKGSRLLGQWANGGFDILHRNRPIRRIEDLDGQKMWALSSAMKSAMKALGAVPVPVPGVDMFTVLSQGVIDGLVSSIYSLQTFQVDRHVRYITLVRGGMGAISFSLIMNPKKFAKLSKDDRAALIRASGVKVARSARSIDDVNRAEFESHQSTIQWIEADDRLMASLEARLAFVRKAWIERAAKRGIEGEAAIAYFKSQMN